NAKLIRSIDTNERGVEPLERLKGIMTRNIETLPYGYLDQALRRCEAALPSAKTDAEKDLLKSIRSMALWRIQRMHMESRP
ncbi:MAG: hypothetical protein ABF308_17020, partial [Phaeobacter gallaeciensis]